jgi:hypothetical protein
MMNPVTIANSLYTGPLLDPPYAQELERGVWRPCIAGGLEAQYIQERLSDSRLVIRVA